MESYRLFFQISLLENLAWKPLSKPLLEKHKQHDTPFLKGYYDEK